MQFLKQFFTFVTLQFIIYHELKMKQIRFNFLGALAILMLSCNEKRLVDYSYMNIRENLWYYENEDEPFTGTSFFNFFGDSSVVDYKNGRWDGRFIIYYANGYVDTERNYRQDVLHGRYYKGTLDGTTLVRGQYRNGKMYGTWYYYEQNGALREKIRY